MRRFRTFFHSSKKTVVTAVCAAEILLVPYGLTACTANNSSTAQQITLEKAEEIALADAEVTASDVTSIKTKPDSGSGVYDIEFYANDVKYEYEITADTGNIYSRSKKIQDKEILTNQENVPGNTEQDIEQDITPAAETQPDAEPVSDGSQQNAELSDTAGQNTAQPDTIQQDTDQPGKTQQNTAQPGETQQNTTQSTPGGNGQISLDDAKNAALTDAGLSSSDVIYTKEKLDYEDGIAVYDIEFYTGTREYDYEIDASTGAVYSKDVETHHAGTGHRDHTQTSGTYIGDDSAKTIALDHAGFSASDVTRLKSKFDLDDGWAVYEVEFYKDGREYDYEIDASDGSILKYEVD